MPFRMSETTERRRQSGDHLTAAGTFTHDVAEASTTAKLASADDMSTAIPTTTLVQRPSTQGELTHVIHHHYRRAALTVRAGVEASA